MFKAILGYIASLRPVWDTCDLAWKKNLRGEGSLLLRPQVTHQNLNKLDHRHKSDAILHRSLISVRTSLGKLLIHSFKINDFMQLDQYPHSRHSIN